MVDEIAERISMLIRTMKTRSNESNLASTDGHMESLLYSLDLNSKKRVRVVGITERGGNGREIAFFCSFRVGFM